MATNNAINTENPIQVARGGTGAVTLTGVLTGNGTSAVTANAVTQYGTVIAGASNAVSSVAPSATSGVPYISQGAAANPAFGTAVVAGGGTGAVTLTDHGVLIGRGTAAIEVTAAGATGETLMGATGANPTYTNSPSFGGSVTAATTITATAGDLTLTNGDALIGNTDAGVTAPFVYFQKSRSGGVITSGDDLGEVAFQGHDGTSFFTSARIRADSSGTIAAGRIASTMQFYTAPDSATASTLRMSIAPTGEVTIAAPDSGTGLTVTAGGITATAGNIAASSGTLSASTTVTAGTNLVSTAGNLLLPTTSSTVGRILINNVVYGHAFGTDSIFLGNLAGNYTYTGVGQHAAVGTSCLAAMTSAVRNSILGYQAGLSVTTGSDNVFIGHTCADAVTTSSDNVAIGSNTMGALTTSTGSNVCVGSSALAQVTTGNTNIAIGTAAAFNLTGSDGQNIMIGQCRGTAGDNTKIRIGFTTTNTALITKTFIDGIRGVTTDVVDALPVLVDSAGQLGTVSSSLRFKDNIQDMGFDSSPIIGLRPVTFTFKAHPGKKQFGLIAEEVKEIMPELVVHNQDGEVESVKYHDLPALLLNELQKAVKIINQLQDRVAVLENK